MKWPAQRSNKYGAKRTSFAGRTFDSAKESRRFAELLLLERGGHIAELECQPKFAIIVNNVKICDVLLDFSYVEIASGQRVYEDVKSKATEANAVSRLKRKLLYACHNVEPRIL